MVVDEQYSNSVPVPPAAPGMPAQPSHGHYHSPPPAEPKKRDSFFRSAFRTLGRGIIILSLILNVYLIILLSSGMQQKVYREGDYKQKIALIGLDGQIDMKTAAEFREKLIRARDDKNVKGVILVINSPGGSVTPTEMIHRYITDFKKQTDKKVIAAIEQVGASGAYWIATAADEIYAQTDSIVGSIGVIYINMVIETALKEKLGIDPIVLKSTRSPYKDQMSFFRHPTDQEIAEIRRDLDRVHERFVKVVSQCRNIPEEQVWTLADGDIHDGEESQKLNLVDKVGFLDDAIKDLAGKLGFEDPMVVHYFNPPSLRELITATTFAAQQNPLDLHRQIEQLAMNPKIVALWPGQ
jgi:protease IV